MSQVLEIFEELYVGFSQYSVRVRSSMTDSTSDFVMASIPIRCLLSSNSQESLALELTDDNKIISMDYRSNCPVRLT